MADRLRRSVAALVLCLGVAACDTAPATATTSGSGGGAGPPPDGGTAVSPAAPATTGAKPPPAARITYPAHGHRKWAVAPAGETVGDEGRLLRYRVAVEKDIEGVSPVAFAAAVSATLGDAHGWTAGGQWSFRRVGPGQHADFTVYLATPDTRDTLCAEGSDGYTSCRNGGDVVLNVARWVKGVPRYGQGSLATYRRYMVNHEVGHKLGQGHQLCPGPGRAAPVMQQQTLGLHGCRPNPWPYPDGHRLYAGRSGTYDDPLPERDTGSR